MAITSLNIATFVTCFFQLCFKRKKDYDMTEVIIIKKIRYKLFSYFKIMTNLTLYKLIDVYKIIKNKK